MESSPLKSLPRGSVNRISEELGITPGAVSQWQKVPASRVLDVERITGISRHELRPDIFGPAPRRSRVHVHEKPFAKDAAQ